MGRRGHERTTRNGAGSFRNFRQVENNLHGAVENFESMKIVRAGCSKISKAWIRLARGFRKFQKHENSTHGVFENFESMKTVRTGLPKISEAPRSKFTRSPENGQPHFRYKTEAKGKAVYPRTHSVFSATGVRVRGGRWGAFWSGSPNIKKPTGSSSGPKPRKLRMACA